MKFSIELNYEITPPGCDFIFSIHAALTQQQIVVAESLFISQNLQPNLSGLCPPDDCAVPRPVGYALSTDGQWQ